MSEQAVIIRFDCGSTDLTRLFELTVASVAFGADCHTSRGGGDPPRIPPHCFPASPKDSR